MPANLLTTIYDPALVALSMGVSMLASFVALDVAARIWPARGWPQAAWITAAAVAMGGGIWAMHFIAMLAFSLPVEVQYDVPGTLLSLAIAIIVTAVGFTIVAGGHGWRRLLPAGMVMGIGVAAMHYTGMAAMRMPAIMTYTPGLFATSIVIACAAATAALWIALRISGLRWRAGAAVIMAVAVSGMHYTGMAATCFTPTLMVVPTSAVQFERGMLAVVVAIGTLLILGLELVSAAVDRRFVALRNREAEILRLSARRFRNLVQSSNDVILVVDQAGIITYAAPSSRTAVSYSSGDLSGRDIFSMIDGSGIEPLRAALTAEEDRAAFAFVDHLKLRDGENRIRDFEATVCNLVDEPSVGGIVVTLHDVTERERSVRELLRAKQIADEANRLKSEFIANMNHELRTPLNAILGFSELIANDESGRLTPMQYRGYARDIHWSGEQLLALINDILDFSRTEAGQLSIEEASLNPAHLVAESVRTMLPAASKKTVEISHTAATDLPMLRGDVRRLRQILLNLLSNAVKFTPSGGKVVVRAGWTPEGGIEISVTDTGIGIPAEKLERITEPFYQVDGSHARHQEGTGLGLAIARSLAELHGAKLVFSSQLGQGVVARLVLPPSRIVLSNAA